MSHYSPYKSESKPYSSGSPVEFTNFVQPKGPNGGRTVITRFVVCVTGTITVATGTWDGRDVPRIMSRITVEKKDSRQRWGLSGARSRIASIYFGGIDRHIEHGTVAIGASQAVDLRLTIPMSKRYSRKPDAYALPADLLGKVVIDWDTLANAASGTAVLSAQALHCYILAHWYEERAEHGFRFHCDDFVKSLDFTSQTEAKLFPSGPVQDLLIHKTGTTAGGGESLAAITDARIEDLGIPILTAADLKQDYRFKRQLGNSGPTTPATERFLDPVIENKVIPVIVSDEDTKQMDGKILESFKLTVGTGVASSMVIYRELSPHSEADFAAQLADSGLKPSDLEIETANGNTVPAAVFGAAVAKRMPLRARR